MAASVSHQKLNICVCIEMSRHSKLLAAYFQSADKALCMWFDADFFI